MSENSNVWIGCDYGLTSDNLTTTNISSCSGITTTGRLPIVNYQEEAKKYLQQQEQQTQLYLKLMQEMYGKAEEKVLAVPSPEYRQAEVYSQEKVATAPKPALAPRTDVCKYKQYYVKDAEGVPLAISMHDLYELSFSKPEETAARSYAHDERVRRMALLTKITKRNIREWPVCGYGGEVELVFWESPNSDTLYPYFCCKRCHDAGTKAR